MKTMLITLAVFTTICFGSVALAIPPTPNVNANITNDSSNPVPVDANITNDSSNPVPVDANITNDSSNPVPVTTQPTRGGLDESHISVSTKFTLSFIAIMNDGEIAGYGDPYKVPEGKRLVIEYASFDPAATPSAPDPGAAYTVFISIQNPTNTASMSHVLGVASPIKSSTGTTGGINTSWEGGAMVRIYAGPGETIRPSVGRNFDQDPLSVVVNLTGYLEVAN